MILPGPLRQAFGAAWRANGACLARGRALRSWRGSTKKEDAMRIDTQFSVFLINRPGV